MSNEEIVQQQPTRPRSNSYDQAINTGLTETQISSSQTRPADSQIYLIKWIEFNRDKLPILLQNRNGPCPLLAVANILLLCKRIRLPMDTGAISTEEIMAMIADHILQTDLSKLSYEVRLNYEQNIQDAFAILAKLRTGIDINLKFHRVDQFEYTPECIVFDILGIRLFHGWIVDPQDRDLSRIITSGASSYNQLVEKMIRQRGAEREDLARESLLIEQFLQDNRSQLTHYGLMQLQETMKDNELAVFFRNNHFSTIWKNQKRLLVLVSDQGYLDHPSIVFETLTGVDNDSVFTDGYGEVWRKQKPADTSQDGDLAINLQNEQVRRYNEQQKELKKKRKSKEKKDDCNLS